MPSKKKEYQCRYFIVKNNGRSRRCEKESLESFYFCERHTSKVSRKKEPTKIKKTQDNTNLLAVAQYQRNLESSKNNKTGNSNLGSDIPPFETPGKILNLASHTISIGSFNILSNDESAKKYDLITPKGKDDFVVGTRLEKLAHVISEMFKTCDIVVTQENDLFLPILHAIQLHQDGKTIKGMVSLDKQPHEVGNQSFLDICGNTNEVSTLAQLYGKEINDTYQSGNGIAIYYDSQAINCVSDDCKQYQISEDGYIMEKFLHIKAKKYFDIVGVHLSEEKKVGTFEKIVKKVADSKSENVVYAICCNTSIFHTDSKVPQEYNLWSSGMRDHGLRDGVCPYGYESFQMQLNREATDTTERGFIFDQMDKILFNQNYFCNIPRPWVQTEFKFTKYNMNKNYNNLKDLRANDVERKKLTRPGTSPESTQSEVFKNHEFHGEQLYPNADAPSNHPPVVITLQFDSICKPATGCTVPTQKKSAFIMND